MGAQHSRAQQGTAHKCPGCWLVKGCMPACLAVCLAAASNATTKWRVLAVLCCAVLCWAGLGLQVLLLTCPVCATTAASPGPSPSPS